MSLNSTVFGFTFAVGLFFLAMAWFSTTSMALYCIRKGNVRRHKEWMIRSYIVTFAFVTFWILTDYVPYEEWWGLTKPEVARATIWMVWVVPMMAFEIYKQARQV